MRNLNYRTIRYPGHAAIMRALLNDLRLRDRREVLKDILEHAVPTTLQDVVIIFVTVSGRMHGQLVQETYANKIYSREVDGRTLSAIQITTAAAICAVLDLLAGGKLPTKGFIRQEDIPLQGVPGEPLRPGLRQAGDRAGPAFRGGGTMTAPSPPVRDEALAILSRLGVTDDAFARDGLAAAFADHRRDHRRRSAPPVRRRSALRSGGRRPPSRPGAWCRRRGAASSCGFSARSCAPPRPTSAASSRSKPARSSPKASAKCRR